MRDRSIRRPAFRPVYVHALTVAHMNGGLIAVDHPSWAHVETALARLKMGEADAINDLERELVRLRDQATL